MTPPGADSATRASAACNRRGHRPERTEVISPDAAVPSRVAGAEGLTSEQYKSVFRRHAAGVAVVTTNGPAGPVGFTATSVISVSADPPLLAFSVHSGSSSWSALSAAETVVVNLLAEDQAEVSARFAAHGHDRFAAGDWSRLPTGEPVLHGTQAWVRARVIDRVPVGTSFLVILCGLTHDVTRPDARPLVYRDRNYYGIDTDRTR